MSCLSTTFHNVCSPTCSSTSCCSTTSAEKCRSLKACMLDPPRIDATDAFCNFYKNLISLGVTCFGILMGLMIQQPGPFNPEASGYDLLPKQHCPILITFNNKSKNCLLGYAIIQNLYITEIKDFTATCIL